MKRRVLAFAALWLAVAGAATLAPGCYGNNCLGGFEVYGADAGQGMMLDENKWATGPVDGDWLWFPRQRLYFFEIPGFGGRTPNDFRPFISAVPNPKTGELTTGAGNIALISGFGPNRVAVRNDTCSDYYLYFIAEASPSPPATPEAGLANTTEDADAGIADAAADAEAGP
jgi:hypothetical protein